jgi:hypothetical protein
MAFRLSNARERPLDIEALQEDFGLVLRRPIETAAQTGQVAQCPVS